MYNRPNIGMFIKVRMFIPDGLCKKKKRRYPPFFEVWSLYSAGYCIIQVSLSAVLCYNTVFEFNADNYMVLDVVVLRKLLYLELG